MLSQPCLASFYRRLQLLLIATAINLPAMAQVRTPPRGSDTLSFHGHIVVFNTPQPDTLPPSGYSAYPVITLAAPVPETIDGAPVYRQVDHPPFSSNTPNWDEALFYQIRRQVAALEDGRYHLRIFNLVVGKEGGTAYYELDGIARFNPRNGTYEKLQGPLQDTLSREIAGFLDGLMLVPAMRNGHPVAAAIGFNRSIVVQGHAAWLQED